jgi:hypothetical protein
MWGGKLPQRGGQVGGAAVPGSVLPIYRKRNTRASKVSILFFSFFIFGYDDLLIAVMKKAYIVKTYAFFVCFLIA